MAKRNITVEVEYPELQIKAILKKEINSQFEVGKEYDLLVSIEKYNQVSVKCEGTTGVECSSLYIFLEFFEIINPIEYE